MKKFSWQEFSEALNELVEMGLVVVVEQINPQTGQLEKIYHHHEQAPKKN